MRSLTNRSKVFLNPLLFKVFKYRINMINRNDYYAFALLDNHTKANVAVLWSYYCGQILTFLGQSDEKTKTLVIKLLILSF